jgi:glucose/arabinose dehydrogenase
VLESARSAALRVTMLAQTVARGQNIRPAAASMDRAATNAEVLRHGSTLRAELVADGLDSPADLAFASDGRLFVAERRGRIRVVRDGRLLSEPALSLADALGSGGQLVALALDPHFERTRYAFAIYTAPARSGEPMFTLARFREVADTLGDRAVLLDGVRASSPSPAAALRFGPDGKLYAAFDDGGDARRRRDPASLNGKVLRLDPDGTTPGDANGGTPVYADGFQSPVALDWDPPTATLWVADRAAGASPFAFYRGALFPAWAGRLLSASDRMAVEAFTSSPRVVAIGPDGAIYYGTAGAIGRLVPRRGP